MEIKEVDVLCPCCDTRLTVDVRTGKVIRYSERREEGEAGKAEPHDFDAISRRVEDRLGGAKEKFEQGLAREQSRGKDLDELFRKANEKLKEDDDED